MKTIFIGIHHKFVVVVINTHVKKALEGVQVIKLIFIGLLNIKNDTQFVIQIFNNILEANNKPHLDFFTIVEGITHRMPAWKALETGIRAVIIQKIKDPNVCIQFLTDKCLKFTMIVNNILSILMHYLRSCEHNNYTYIGTIFTHLFNEYFREPTPRPDGREHDIDEIWSHFQARFNEGFLYFVIENFKNISNPLYEENPAPQHEPFRGEMMSQNSRRLLQNSNQLLRLKITNSQIKKSLKNKKLSKKQIQTLKSKFNKNVKSMTQLKIIEKKLKQKKVKKELALMKKSEITI